MLKIISKLRGRLRGVESNLGKLDELLTEVRDLRQRIETLEDPRNAPSLFRALQHRAQEKTIRIIEAEMIDAIHIEDHRLFLRHALSHAGPGMVLEFGVFSGRTVTWMATDFPDRRFAGFDTFQGLPETWSGYTQYDFDRGGTVPEVPANVEIIVGPFAKTAAEFAVRGEKIAAIHVDCDLYSSTRTIFEDIGPSLEEGCVLIFDEYFNYFGFENHERKAFLEYLAHSGLKPRWLSYSGQQAACILVA